MEMRTRIKVLRAERGMTQEELAARVNVRRETILHLESGKYIPLLKLAIDIAKVFEKPVEEIFFFDE